jgi:hypothetical protein
VTIATGTDRGSIPLSQVLRLVPLERAAAKGDTAKVWIELTDGSRLHATSYGESAGTAVVGLCRGDQIEIPARSVRWVRLNPPRDAIDPQWDKMVSRPASVDVVVVRRDGSSLDYVEGALGRVTEETVEFTLEGEAIEVPRSRLEGLVYYVPQRQERTAVICQVRDGYGNCWAAARVELSGERLQVRTGAGAEVSFPLSHIEQLDFAGANVVYLSDLEPLKVEWTPLLASQAVEESLARLFHPRRDQSFGGGKLRLRFTEDTHRVEAFDRGLAIHSRTELAYRVPDGFRRLAGWAGMDERAGASGTAELTISGDGETLLRRVITAHDEPLLIDLPVAGVRRLSLLVDFANEDAVAGQLDLCNIRITK